MHFRSKQNWGVTSGTFFLLLTLIFSSCASYDEGGPLRKAPDNILGTWSFSSYLRNDVDETTTVMISDYTETYVDGGTLNRYYLDDEGLEESESGAWAFSDDFTQISISDVSSIGEWSAEHSTLSTSAVTIIKLDEGELWYEFENGGDTHQFRFAKQ